MSDANSRLKDAMRTVDLGMRPSVPLRPLLEDKADVVDHPAHYGGGDNPYETIKVLQAWLTDDEFIGFLKGNSIKYQSRHRQKGGLDDLKKSEWYQRRLVEFLEAK